MALISAFGILGGILSLPNLILGIYNLLNNRLIMAEMNILRQPTQTLRSDENSARAIVDSMGLGKPAVRDNIDDDDQYDTDNFNYSI